MELRGPPGTLGAPGLPFWDRAPVPPPGPLQARSGEQRRPCGIGRRARCRNPALVAARQIGRVERGPRIAARIAEEHEHATVGREGRSLVVEAFGQDALTGTVRFDDADRELPSPLTRE